MIAANSGSVSDVFTFTAMREKPRLTSLGLLMSLPSFAGAAFALAAVLVCGIAYAVVGGFTGGVTRSAVTPDPSRSGGLVHGAWASGTEFTIRLSPGHPGTNRVHLAVRGAGAPGKIPRSVDVVAVLDGRPAVSDHTVLRHHANGFAGVLYLPAQGLYHLHIHAHAARVEYAMVVSLPLYGTE